MALAPELGNVPLGAILGTSFEAVGVVINEVKDEMFEPEAVKDEPDEPTEVVQSNTSDTEQEVKRLITPNGNEVRDAEHYKAMLAELVDALDDAISHKIKLTQYIDKLLKKKYRTYVRLKSDDKE